MQPVLSRWEVVPPGLFSRHFNLVRDGETVATLRMQLWTEGCEFAISGHEFAIRKTSLWKDGFQLLAGQSSVCEVRRGFWSRRFELEAIEERWNLQPAGWFTRTYQLISDKLVVGTIRHTGLFTRSRVAEFAESVPPPVQVFAIFLVLVISQRQQNAAAAST